MVKIHVFRPEDFLEEQLLLIYLVKIHLHLNNRNFKRLTHPYSVVLQRSHQRVEDYLGLHRRSLLLVMDFSEVNLRQLLTILGDYSVVEQILNQE
jgi:hypothetical protein